MRDGGLLSEENVDQVRLWTVRLPICIRIVVPELIDAVA